MGALIKYDSGRRVHLKEATRYVNSKRHGRVLIVPDSSGFAAEGAKTFEMRLGCLEERFKFREGVVIATDEDLGQLSVGFRGLNLDG